MVQNFFNLVAAWITLAALSANVQGLEANNPRLLQLQVNKDSASQGRRLANCRNSDYSPPRIHVQYGDLADYDAADVQMLKDQIIPNVIKHASNAVWMRGIAAGCKLIPTYDDVSCGETLPQDFIEHGIDADLYVVVSSTSSWFLMPVFGAQCDSDRDEGYIPKIITLFLNKDRFQFEETLAPEDYHAMFMRAMVIAFGFSSWDTWYWSYRDENGNHTSYDYQILYEQEVGGGLDEDGNPKQGVRRRFLATPRVLAEAQKHFNCPTLRGMPLENQDDAHFILWEKRVFSDDYLTADTRLFDPVLSRLTCAALEDTGWFKCNYDYTGPMNWGKNKGCGFLEENCFIRDQPLADHFCTEQHYYCDYNAIQSGFCDINEGHEDDPEYMQHLSDKALGCENNFMDNCPWKQMYGRQHCWGLLAEPQQAGYVGYSTGINTRCVEGDMVPSGNAPVRDVFCLELKECTPTHAIFINHATDYALLDDNISCKRNAQGDDLIATVNGMDGGIYCRPDDAFCWPDTPCPHACRGVGRCVNGHCLCDAGYGGIDCSVSCTNADCHVCKPDDPNFCLSCKNRAATDGSGGCPADCPSGEMTKDAAGVCRCGSEKVQDGFACVSACPTTKYSQDGLCESCLPLCDECSNQRNCTKCTPPNKLYDGYCLGECPYYSIPHPYDSNKCLPCIGCATCAGEVVNCTSCQDYQYLYKGTCVTQCPDDSTLEGKVCNIYPICDAGQYHNEGTCKPCDTTKCKECIKTATKCTACNSQDEEIINGECKRICVEGELRVRGECVNCNGCYYCDRHYDDDDLFLCNCGYVNGVQTYWLTPQQQCVEDCGTGWTQTDYSSRCEKCIDPCEACDWENGCTKCPTPMLIDQWYCVDSCPDFYYEKEGACMPCSYDCLVCKSYDICEECEHVLFEGQCYYECPIYTYQVEKECFMCNFPCFSCVNSADTCTDCKILQQSVYANKCVDDCPDGTFSETIDGGIRVCSDCINSCATCENTATTCSSCLEWKVLVGNECKDGCAEGTGRDAEGNCVACTDPECNLCDSDADVCTQCKKTHKVHEGVCKTDCPTGTLSQNVTNDFLECQDCVNCEVCEIELEHCTSCENPYFLHSNRCLDTCPDQMYGDSNLCKSCVSPCKTCKSETDCDSCVEKYVLNGDVCDACPDNCDECTNSSTCTTCSSTYLLYMSGCVQACPVGYYDEWWTEKPACLSCDGCAECQGSATFCTKCSSGTYLHDYKCLSTCPDTFYANTANNDCLPCVFPCKNCKGATKCESCIAGRELFEEQTCVDKCPKGMFDEAGVCIDCSGDCLACVTEATKCTECPVPKYIHGNKCLTTCPDTYYNNADLRICGSCQPPCVNCENDATTCTSCIQGKVRDGSICVDMCPNGKFDNSSVCEDCSTPCQHCENTAITCTSCIQGKLLDVNSCVDSCPEGKIDINSVCTDCEEPCKTCKDTVDFCTNCIESYELIGNVCQSPCDPGQVPVGQVCMDCTSPCATCVANQATCLTCEGAKYLKGTTCVDQCAADNSEIQINKRCEECTDSCATCQTRIDNCLTCTGSKVLQEDDDGNGGTMTKCLNECLPGYWNDNKTCKKCNNNCLTCSGSAEHCDSCKTSGSYQLLEDNVCVSTCSTKYYVSGTDCLKCAESCATCETTAINCTSCSGSLNLNAATGECVTTCPDATYANSNECKACDTTKCATCSSTATNCESCNLGTFLEVNACVATCPDGKVGISRVCEDCAPQCQTCVDLKDKCTLCTGNKLVYEHGCYDECPETTYEDSGQCKDCSADCLKCNDNTDCKQCSATTYKHNKACVSECPDDTFANDSRKCEPCLSPCESCYNKTECKSCLTLNLYEKTCVAECPDDKPMAVNKVCSACHPKCKTCETEQITVCQSCWDDAFFYADSNNCIMPCPDGYFGNTTTRECDICHSTCQTCTAAGNDKCLLCKNSGQTSVNGSCTGAAPECPTGKFKMDDDTECKRDCVTYAGCTNCVHENSKTMCLSCDNEKERLDTMTGECKCIGFQEGGQCKDCHETCYSCYSASDSACRSCWPGMVSDSILGKCKCRDGYYFDAQAKECKLCAETCTTCTSATSCTDCIAWHIVPEGGGVCMCDEPNSRYVNDSGECVLCHTNCQRCVNPGTDTSCTECKPPFTVVEATSKCGCGKGTYMIDDTNCLRCHASCGTCQGADKCDTCKDTVVWESDAEQKYCQCIDTHYENPPGTCKQCQLPCIHCTGLGSENCLSCVETDGTNFYKFDMDRSKCQIVPKCDTGTFLDTSKDPWACTTCDASCRTCEGLATSCTDCSAPLILDSKQCKCPAGKYDDGNGGCSDCIANCKECTDASSCDTCVNNFSEKNGACVCTDGWYSTSPTTCARCNGSCKTCEDTPTKCTDCHAGATFDQANNKCTNVGSCGDGYYHDPDDAVNPCKACGETCKTCEKAAPSVCLTCDTLQEFTKAGDTCVCVNKYFYDTTSKTCVGCHPSCATCDNTTECKTCATSFIEPLKETEKLCVCDTIDGWYLVAGGQTCGRCSLTCETCDIVGHDQCTRCKEDDNRTLALTVRGGGKAGACPCKSTHYYKASSDKCEEKPANVNACKTASFVTTDASSIICKPCDPNCLTCNGPSSHDCTKCKEDSRLSPVAGLNGGEEVSGTCECVDKSGGVCQPKNCPEGFYKDENHGCVQCNKTCKTCGGPSQKQCTACPPNRKPSSNDTKFECNCKFDYTQPDNFCADEPVYGECGLTNTMCKRITGKCLQTTAKPKLDDPTNEACLKELYEFCCFDPLKSWCTKLGATFSHCGELNAKPVSARFTTVGNAIEITFDKKILVNPSTSTCSSMIDNFVGTANCHRHHNNHMVLNIVFSARLTTDEQYKVGSTLAVAANVIRSQSKWDVDYNVEKLEVEISSATVAPAFTYVTTAPHEVSSCDTTLTVDVGNSWVMGAYATSNTWEFARLSPGFILDSGNHFDWEDGVELSNDGFRNSDSIDVTVKGSIAKKAEVSKTLSISINQTYSIARFEFAYDQLTINSRDQHTLQLFVTIPDGQTCSQNAGKFEYLFEMAGDMTGAWTSKLTSMFDVSTRMFTFPKNTFEHDKTYVIEAKALFDSKKQARGKASITLNTLKAPPLNIEVQNGDRVVGLAYDVELMVKKHEYSTIDEEKDWTFVWTCEDWSEYPSAVSIYSYNVDSTQLDAGYKKGQEDFTWKTCLSANSVDLMNVITEKSTKLVIPKNQLKTDTLYYFRVTAKYKAQEGKAAAWVKVAADEQPTIDITVSSKFVSPNRQTFLYPKLDNLPVRKVEWKVTTETSSTDITFFVQKINSLLSFQGSQLRPQTTYTFTLSSTDPTKPVYASKQLMLNNPPQFGSLVLKQSSGSTDTKFTIKFDDWNDAEEHYPLEYKLIQKGKTAKHPDITKAWSTRSIIRGLQFHAGTEATTIGVYGRVIDSLGAYTNTSAQTVTISKVTVEDAAMKAKDALSKLEQTAELMTTSQIVDEMTRITNLAKSGGNLAALAGDLHMVADKLDISRMIASDIEQITALYEALKEHTTTEKLTQKVLQLVTAAAVQGNGHGDVFIQNIFEILGEAERKNK